MSDSLQILGTCDKRLFGLTPAERLRRQRGAEPGPILVAGADVVLSDAAVAWLMEHPGTALTTQCGRPAAVAVDPSDQAAARDTLEGSGTLPLVNPALVPDVFVRKLRRRDKLLVRGLEEEPSAKVARDLFCNVYKGVTDVVTKYVWPWPAYWVTRGLAALSIPPNAVTICGIFAMLAAAFLWFQGEIGWGLACAWLMTFLDTVDGKLARATVTSSKLGNRLDHVTDLIHPPIWWVCLAIGIARLEPAASDQLLIACAFVLVTYVIGRIVETAFKKTIGYNAYLWQRFDSAFRLVIARRNTILLIVTLGLITGELVLAFAAAAVWGVISTVIQLVRFSQALRALRSGHVRSWLM